MSREKQYSRSIPHPLFERLIAEDAMNKDEDGWKPERHHDIGYFPGCVDFMDVEVKFSKLNKGDADHASIAAASILFSGQFFFVIKNDQHRIIKLMKN